MSVLKGEGTHLILYGPSPIPARTQIHPGYLARPDVSGRFPVVVVVPDVRSITSGVKALCRVLARHGLAALAYDPYRGAAPKSRADDDEAQAAFAAINPKRIQADLGDVARYLRTVGWAAPAHGLLGIGAGGPAALRFATGHGRSLALAHAPLDDAAVAIIDGLDLPVLGLYGKDGATSMDMVRRAHEASVDGEWALYEGVGDSFLDDSTPGYDAPAFEDASKRLIAFFSRTLAPGAPLSARTG